MAKRGRNMNIIDNLIEALAAPLPLAEINRDHYLQGNYVGYKECHVTPDWLLTYGYEQVNDEQQLLLVRTGTHSDLF
jgi:mRNA interferase YafQ